MLWLIIVFFNCFMVLTVLLPINRNPDSFSPFDLSLIDSCFQRGKPLTEYYHSSFQIWTPFLCAGLLYPRGPPRGGPSSIWRSGVSSDKLRQVQHPPLPLLLRLWLQTSCGRYTDQDGPQRKTHEGESSWIFFSLRHFQLLQPGKLTYFSDICI